MPNILVDIPVPGDWPTTEDVEARDAIVDELSRMKIGRFVNSGDGHGRMDFGFTVPDGPTAEAAVEQAIEKHLPGREYTIRVTEE